MNTALTASSGRFNAQTNAVRPSGGHGRIDRLTRAAWAALHAAAGIRPHGRWLELAEGFESLEPALARHLRAASREGPMA